MSQDWMGTRWVAPGRGTTLRDLAAALERTGSLSLLPLIERLRVAAQRCDVEGRTMRTRLALTGHALTDELEFLRVDTMLREDYETTP